MRAWFLILATIACVSAMEDEDSKNILKGCDMTSAVALDDLNLASDPEAKVKSLCLLRKLEILDENGIIQKDTLKTRIGDFVTKKDTDYAAKIFDWCFAEQGDLPTTALHLIQFCFNNFSIYTLHDRPVQSQILLANFKCMVTVPDYQQNAETSMNCLADTLGLIDSDGKIDKRVLGTVLAEELEHQTPNKNLPIQKMVDEVIENCDDEKESLAQTTKYIFECTNSVFQKIL